jgi:hypothetical protein
MANFTTHIAVGTVVAGSLATLTLAADVIATDNLIPITLAGVLGSVLPDIDLKDSRPSRALFAGLAIFFSFAVLFSAAGRYSIAELWILWLGTLVGVRYGLHKAFHNLATHRGIWHSIPAGLFCAALTAIVFANVMDRHAGVAWLAGGFMFIGYLVHLTLDEIYSVDVMDTRVKASFGTALKLFDRRYPYASASMVAALALAVWLAPSPSTFLTGLASRDMWAELKSELLPKDRWFGVIRAGHAVAGDPVSASDITTGAIPDVAPAAPEKTPK